MTSLDCLIPLARRSLWPSQAQLSRRNPQKPRPIQDFNTANLLAHKFDTTTRQFISKISTQPAARMRQSNVSLGLLFLVSVMAHPIFDAFPVRTAYYPTGTKIVKRQSVEPVSVAAGTVSCHATDHGAFASYNVLIGIPYQGAQGCDQTYNNLEFHWVGLSNWQCVENNGNIQLYFNAGTNLGSRINSGLEGCYPNIAGDFNCPDD